jgi:hypothetical protein
MGNNESVSVRPYSMDPDFGYLDIFVAIEKNMLWKNTKIHKMLNFFFINFFL